jgi:hypothetical protein
MSKKLTYQWMVENINRLEKAVLNICAFCKGETSTFDSPTSRDTLGVNYRAFPQGKIDDSDMVKYKTSFKPTDKDIKRIKLIRFLEEYINHYEFLVLEKKEELVGHAEKHKWDKILLRLEHLREIVDKLSSSLQYRMDIRTHTNIDTLAKISFVFLPLSFVVGYFGMNFTSMGMVGHNVNRKGILMWKDGHKTVILLILMVLAISVGTLYYLQNFLLGPRGEKEIGSLVKSEATAADDVK